MEAHSAYSAALTWSLRRIRTLVLVYSAEREVCSQYAYGVTDDGSTADAVDIDTR